MPACLLAYAFATCILMRLRAYPYALMYASVPTRLCAHAEVFVRHHFTTKREIFHISRKSTVYGWLLGSKRVFGGGFSGI